MAIDDEIKKAFKQAKQHTILLYPIHNKMLNFIILKINNTSKGNILAEAKYDEYLIIVYLPTIIKYKYDKQSMYYVFLHEFARILRNRNDEHSPVHGSVFKIIMCNLGLEDSEHIMPYSGHTVSTLFVPIYMSNGETIKKRYCLLEEGFSK